MSISLNNAKFLGPNQDSSITLVICNLNTFSQTVLFFPSRRFRRQDVRHGNAAQQCFGQQFIGNLLAHLHIATKCLEQKKKNFANSMGETTISPEIFYWHIPIVNYKSYGDKPISSKSKQLLCFNGRTGASPQSVCSLAVLLLTLGMWVMNLMSAF